MMPMCFKHLRKTENRIFGCTIETNAARPQGENNLFRTGGQVIYKENTARKPQNAVFFVHKYHRKSERDESQTKFDTVNKEFADFKREKKLLDAGKTQAENERDEWKLKSGMLENQLESLKLNNTNLENRIKELEDELELCGSGDVRRISAEDERLLSQYKQRYSELRAKFSIGNAAVTAVIRMMRGESE